MPDRKIDPAFVHPSRLDNQVEESKMGLDFVDSVALQDWVVKLEFDQGAGPCNGSGSYVNIPDAQHDIILTAGHNLIGANSQLSQKLTILGKTPSENIDVGNSYEICEDYKRDPQSSNAVNDYGIILVPRVNNQPRPGFGFSLKLAFIDDLEGEVRVTGYRDKTPPGSPITSSGSYTCTEDQIVYKAATEQGISGSPVWVAYNGFETVVAIQYQPPAQIKGERKQGTRLNLKVLSDVFRWAKVGWMSKTVKVWDPTAPPQGLYLRFSDFYPDARVRITADDLETSFDIIPAYTMPTTANKRSFYVFIFKQPQGWTKERGQWVRWDPDGQKVTLSERLRDSCLVTIIQKANGSLKIVRAVGDSKLMEVRMGATRINLEDIDLGIDLETSEVSFATYFKTSKAKVKKALRLYLDPRDAENVISTVTFVLWTLDCPPAHARKWL